MYILFYALLQLWLDFPYLKVSHICNSVILDYPINHFLQNLDELECKEYFSLGISRLGNGVYISKSSRLSGNQKNRYWYMLLVHMAVFFLVRPIISLEFYRTNHIRNTSIP